MEIKINKEIKDYNETIFFGLSVRQFIFSLLACAVSIGIYLIFRDKIGTEMLSWICMLTAAPFAAFGFVKYNHMPLEKVIKVWFRTEFKTPRKLIFRGMSQKKGTEN